MILAKIGRASAGKRSFHLDIKYFFITEYLERGEMKIKLCPTDAMIADYISKSLQGHKFFKFKKHIMIMHVWTSSLNHHEMGGHRR